MSKRSIFSANYFFAEFVCSTAPLFLFFFISEKIGSLNPLFQKCKIYIFFKKEKKLKISIKNSIKRVEIKDAEE